MLRDGLGLGSLRAHRLRDGLDLGSLRAHRLRDGLGLASLRAHRLREDPLTKLDSLCMDEAGV
jgi:hypothetical protein